MRCTLLVPLLKKAWFPVVALHWFVPEARSRSSTGDNEDQNVGINIARRAVEEPLRQIVDNGGDSKPCVLNAVAEGEGNYGYNAATGEYGDMIEMGILDPTKVTRTALQNACLSIGPYDDHRSDGCRRTAGRCRRRTGNARWRHGRHGRIWVAWAA